MQKLVLYFNFEDQNIEYHLPALNNRRMQLDLRDLYGENYGKIDLEVWDGNWFVSSNNQVSFSQNNFVYNTIQLLPNEIVCGEIVEPEIVFTIITVEENADIASYKKYFINNRKEIQIGSDEKSDVCIEEEYVSRCHAVIEKREQGFWIKDKSTNGTFLNGKRLLGDLKLQCFDEIYIMGVKIVFLNSFIAVNAADKAKSGLPEITLENLQTNEKAPEITEESAFSRAPRELSPLDAFDVDIEAPPSKHNNTQQPLLFILGPSVTMPLPIMMSVIFNMSNTSGSSSMYLGTIISVVASGGLGAMWALLQRNYNSKQEKIYEEQRVEGYKKYIEQNKNLLEAKHAYNLAQLEKQFVSSRKLIHIANDNRRNLWNRNVNHKDFLTIRLGKGTIPYPGNIKIPNERFSMMDDELSSLPYTVYEQYHNMTDGVVTMSLLEDKLIGVIGEDHKVQEIARNMILQIAALHSYTDVKIAFLFEENESKNMQWLKWLPHTFSSDKKLRYLANETSSYQNVLYALTSELRTRDEETEEGETKNIPHYIVFCTAPQILEKESIYSYMTSEKDYGFTFVLLYNDMDLLPNECTTIIQNDNEFQGKYSLEAVREASDQILFDSVSISEAESFTKSISNIFVNEMAGGEIPTSIDFLEMMNIANLEQWNLMKHYKENRAYEHIRALIGQTYGNKPMYLDIHEKMYGPHGLVAGTTGSGKSETIMTFILSLAMNYHPDEVAFVLIDYKGGGMAAPFIGLPHTAGTITNIDSEDGTGAIDESQTRRALVSIHSEIRRRQKIFSQYKINHIDAYIRLYRDGEVAEALPHLIIISDEFAELKKEQPDFIKELVSAARVGRSLGIHLILATQKPTGVVDDEIWSNSRFKICLRVQDKQDSMGMLKRPEAAYITGIGRAYLQIGNDEIFEMFQSGYAGAPYIPSDEIVLSQHNEVSMIGMDGRPLVSPPRKKNSNAISQLEACVEYIKTFAKEYGIENTRQLWMPALKHHLTLQEIEENYTIDFSSGIYALVGLVDDPQRQTQYPAMIDLLACANMMIIGNIGVGKTYFLQAMLYSLITHYEPKDFNFYCLDFSSRTFKTFASLPFCGGVAFQEEEEAMEQMLVLLMSIMEERKHAFEQASVGNFAEYRSIEHIPCIVLVVDNYLLFKEMYEELEEKVQLIIREGFKYGIQVVCTGNSVSDLNYRTRQYIGKVIPLYLGERSKYVEALGCSIDYEPANIKGRGLWLQDDVLEFQTALITEDSSALQRVQKLKSDFLEITKKYETVDGAKQVQTIPKEETYRQLLTKVENVDLLPIGYNEQSLVIESISLYETYCFIISAIEKQSVRLFMEHIKEAAEYRHIHVTTIKEGMEYQDLFDLAIELRDLFNERKAYLDTLGTKEDARYQTYQHFEKRIYLIDNLADFIERIYMPVTMEQESLYPIYETFFKKGANYGITFMAYEETADHYNIAGRTAGKNFQAYKQGIHFGGRLDQQKLFDFTLPISKQMKVLDYNEGNYECNNQFYQIYMPIE